MRKKKSGLWFWFFVGAGIVSVGIMIAGTIKHLGLDYIQNAFVRSFLFDEYCHNDTVDMTEAIEVGEDAQGDASDEEAWCLILVNRENRIPDDYEVELVELSNGQCVDRRIYPALQEMFDTARAEGVYPIVASGYRTAKKQQSLMDEKIATYMMEGNPFAEAKRKAEIWVAPVGTSEHQLGISVDINADGVHSAGNEVYAWLDENSYQFGFIKRYPEDKTDVTGIINEPWHYRYVGKRAAAEMYCSGVCLEEYLDGLAQSNSMESDM